MPPSRFQVSQSSFRWTPPRRLPGPYPVQRVPGLVNTVKAQKRAVVRKALIRATKKEAVIRRIKEKLGRMASNSKTYLELSNNNMATYILHATNKSKPNVAASINMLRMLLKIPRNERIKLFTQNYSTANIQNLERVLAITRQAKNIFARHGQPSNAYNRNIAAKTQLLAERRAANNASWNWKNNTEKNNAIASVRKQINNIKKGYFNSPNFAHMPPNIRRRTINLLINQEPRVKALQNNLYLLTSKVPSHKPNHR